MRLIFSSCPPLILIIHPFTLNKWVGKEILQSLFYMRKYTQRASTLLMATWQIQKKNKRLVYLTYEILYFRICFLYFMVTYNINKRDISSNFTITYDTYPFLPSFTIAGINVKPEMENKKVWESIQNVCFLRTRET